MKNEEGFTVFSKIVSLQRRWCVWRKIHVHAFHGRIVTIQNIGDVSLHIDGRSVAFSSFYKRVFEESNVLGTLGFILDQTSIDKIDEFKSERTTCSGIFEFQPWRITMDHLLKLIKYWVPFAIGKLSGWNFNQCDSQWPDIRTYVITFGSLRIWKWNLIQFLKIRN